MNVFLGSTLTRYSVVVPIATPTVIAPLNPRRIYLEFWGLQPALEAYGFSAFQAQERGLIPTPEGNVIYSWHTSGPQCQSEVWAYDVQGNTVEVTQIISAPGVNLGSAIDPNAELIKNLLREIKDLRNGTVTRQGDNQECRSVSINRPDPKHHNSNRPKRQK